MALSGRKIEVASTYTDKIKDVLPNKVWQFPPAIVSLVAGYAWDDFPLKKPTLFSGIDYTLEKIIYLVENAGPLEQFKFYVERLIKKELATETKENILIDTTFTIAKRQGPLIGIIVSGLDCSTKKVNNIEIDKGMAECFTEIVAKLLPHRLQEILTQARKAAPLEDEKTRANREFSNLAAIEQYFSAIKQNNEDITIHAFEAFKDFIKFIKQRSINGEGYLKDNIYYVNIIHLISIAYEVIRKRGIELPRISSQDSGGQHGLIAKHFCLDVIAATLQFELPARPRQILRSGLSKLLYHDKQADRIIDPNGELFCGANTDHLLGVNSYYTDITLSLVVHGVSVIGCSGLWQSEIFKNYYEQLYQSVNSMLLPIQQKSLNQCLTM